MKKRQATVYLLLFALCLPLLCSCSSGKTQEAAPTVVDLNLVQNVPLAPRSEYLALDEGATNIGIYLNTPEEIEALERIPPVIAWFEDWHGAYSKQKIALCGTDHIAVPFITWQPMEISLQDIVDGKQDEYVTGYFTRLALTCPDNDVLLRFAHEMETRDSNDVWYSWQEGDGELFKAAWIHLVELSRKINGNIKWVWSPNRSDGYSAPFYPGDEYVDYVGVTMNLPLEQSAAYPSFERYYQERGIKEHLEQYGKKIILSEVAYPSDDSAAKAAYLQSILDYAEQDPNICLVCFFNEDKADNKRYSITHDETYMRILYEGIERNEEKA